MVDPFLHWQNVQNEVGHNFGLSVIIPAYNEEKRILPFLEEIFNYFGSESARIEVLVVDDGSKDGTAELIRKTALWHPTLRLIQQPKNMGKGAAVRTGMLASRGRLVLFTDADGSTPIPEIERLKLAIDLGAEVAIGSRALFSTETNIKALWYRKLIGRCFNLLVNLLILPGVQDTQCGFKLFTAKAAHTLASHQLVNGFGFDLELLFLTKKYGFAFREVAVNWHNVEGSKVNLIADSAKMFLDIFKIRWYHRN